MCLGHLTKCKCSVRSALFLALMSLQLLRGIWLWSCWALTSVGFVQQVELFMELKANLTVKMWPRVSRASSNKPLSIWQEHAFHMITHSVILFLVGNLSAVSWSKALITYSTLCSWNRTLCILEVQITRLWIASHYTRSVWCQVYSLTRFRTIHTLTHSLPQ